MAEPAGPGLAGGQADDDPRVRQDTEAAQDAYVAARDLIIHNYAEAARPRVAPGLVRRQVWGDVPARNPGFTSRKKLLAAVRRRLLAGDWTVVQALHGMGGVGKTQLVIEYAHRFAADYEVVWWLAAEGAELIGAQFATLAEALGCTPPGAQLTAVRRAVLAELRERDRWLVIFDNAENPEDIADWLPAGPGHVLITSRSRGWHDIAVPVEVDVLSRAESVSILRHRVNTLLEGDADRVADAVGDLPLAVAQAAGYIADTGITAREYTDLVTVRPAEILDQARPSSYRQSLAAVTLLTLDQLRRVDPAAADLMGICAFLAPEPVAADWFTLAAAQLPGPLAHRAADPVEWRQVLARAGRSALARVDHHGVQMHRLTQAIIRGGLPPDLASALRAGAEAVVVAGAPGDAEMPGTWPSWGRLLPHMLALDPVATDNGKLQARAQDAAWYLVDRGDARSGFGLADRLYRGWRDRFGPDHRAPLLAARAMGHALRRLGRYREAREIDEDTLARQRRLYGQDHPGTLADANNLAFDLRELGEVQAARELDEDTLARMRRVLGENDSTTLKSANNLAEDLQALGEVQAARELNEDTLARRRRLFGEENPFALMAAHNLAENLHALGELRAARELDEDTLARRRQILGEDHPLTLTTAHNLAKDLHALGEVQAARQLEADTLARCRRVLGEDHPDTQRSARGLAAYTRALSET